MPPKKKSGRKGSAGKAAQASAPAAASQAASAPSASSGTAPVHTTSGKQPSRKPATRSTPKKSSSLVHDQAEMETPSPSPSPAPAAMSSDNAIQPPPGAIANSAITDKVIEYLVKKGYTRTEQTLRQESAHLDKDGRPIHNRVEELGNIKYTRGFKLLSTWIEQNLDVYKFELRRLPWPIFVYSYLDMLINDATEDAEAFFREFSPEFGKVHEDELRVLETIKLRSQVLENSTAKLYRDNKYSVPLNLHVYFNLLTFLETNTDSGGAVIIYLLQTYCQVRTVESGPLDQFSFEAIINQARGRGGDDANIQEGIPGAFTGVSNKDIMDNNAALKLGPVPMDPDLIADVRAELEVEDQLDERKDGRSSLVDEYDRYIKREDSNDGPSRADIPYPPSRQRDVTMEVQKIKENRDRFKIEKAGDLKTGIAPGVSICMFTFHNTLDAINCISFSDDNDLVAVGTAESYIRVWNLHGEPLPTLVKAHQNRPPTSSRRLIGHSGPVYEVSFSPSIQGPPNPSGKTPSTSPKYLLSCSADGTIRLWSLETWTSLLVYKGHDKVVWQVKWGPFGHYFASCGWDKTVRVWAQDHISPLRIMVGHDTSVNCVAWHPNGAYIFSASDTADKTIRMWSFSTGECVRVFSGHANMISALECAPNGRILASADADGIIFLWDIQQGTLIKRCRGHLKGNGIWSLSFSVESSILISGSGDGTVRVWDVAVAADPSKPTASGDTIARGGTGDATRIDSNAPNVVPPTVGAKKKGKDTMITPDQIAAYPTKKSPVYRVKLTRMNLVVAGSCYLP